jgi:hypothetical protein
MPSVSSLSFSATPSLQDGAAGRDVQMLLVLDYGNGGVELCERAGDGLAWRGRCSTQGQSNMKRASELWQRLQGQNP